MSRDGRVALLGQALGVVLVTAALLACIEIGAGFFTRPKPPPQPTPEIPGDTVSRTLTWLELNPAPLIRDVDLLWRNEPGARKTQPVNPQPYGRDDTWTIENNSEGFRGAERNAGGDDPGVLRILCIGDSITFGFNVDQPDSYPRQLEGLLAVRHPGRRFEIVNAGVPGWSWLQGLRFLELRGRALHPDIVIIGHGTNDQFLPAKVTDEERFHRLGGPVARAARAAALRLTETNSYRLVEQFFPPPPFTPDRDSPACLKQIARTGFCRRVSVDQISAAASEVHRLVSAAGATMLMVNFDFAETAAVQGMRRSAERDAIPFVDAVAHLRSLRAQDADARAAELGLRRATRSEAPDPAPTPPARKRLVLRIVVPDSTATYEVRGQAYFQPHFTFVTPAYDDGTNGDERAGDGVRTAEVDVPADIGGVQYLFYRNGEPELRPLPPMASSVGDRLIGVPADTLGPVEVFGRLLYMAERAHPNREGHAIVAARIADALATLPSFQRFVETAAR